jgi:CBS domain-containing protein
MTSIDPAAYVRSVPPFDALAPALFDEAARELEVTFHPAGARLVQAGGERLRHLYVIRKGSVRLEREGATVQVLEEGEIFGYVSLLKREATLDVVVEEELVAYRLPDRAFERLLEDARFASHFALRVTERLQATIGRAELASIRPDLAVEVERIAPRAPVWVDPDVTVGDAARRMREERISSVLVRGDPPAILTDRDLGGRVLAEGRGPETRVADVATSPLWTVPATTPVHVAWSRLLGAGVHHLPLTRDGAIVGMVTAGDLLRHTAPGPIALLRRVERLASRDRLSGYGRRVAEMSAALVASGLDALVTAGFVARLNDALLHRILEWAQEDLGPAPAPWAWIVFGSEGRMEQTLLTDQDNALVWADEGAPGRAWFQSLAERVNADLVAAGFPECPGGYMARRWNGPLGEWISRFRGWLEVPNPAALLVASIFFDFRRVGGTLDVAPLEGILAEAGRKTSFLRHFAASATEYRPPPSFLLRLRGETSIVDLKSQGISPIAFLARPFALEAGSTARSTVERLDAAARAGLVDEDERARVVEAFRFLLGLRLRRQLDALSRGAPITSKVALSDLTAIERTRVKEAFRAVTRWQDHAKHHYQTGF